MKKYRLLIAVIVFDLIVLLLHLLFGHSNLLFNLDSEQNIPTIYQGTKLILISTILFTFIYQLAYVDNKLNLNKSLIWIPLYVTFLFLGIDEIGQIHETATTYLISSGSDSIENYVSFFDKLDFSSSKWLLIYIPAFISFLGYSYILFKSIIKEYRRESRYLLVGIILFTFVPLLEFLGTTDTLYFSNKYETLMVLEETSEMIGASFLLYFSWIVLIREKSSNYKT